MLIYVVVNSEKGARDLPQMFLSLPGFLRGSAFVEFLERGIKTCPETRLLILSSSECPRR